MKIPETSLQALSYFSLLPPTPKRACSQATANGLETSTANAANANTYSSTLETKIKILILYITNIAIISDERISLTFLRGVSSLIEIPSQESL